MRVLRIAVVFTAWSLLIASPVFADAAPEFSAWAGIGYASVEGFEQGSDYSGAGLRVGAGMDLNLWFALGIGWTDLGSGSGFVADVSPLPSSQDSSAFWLGIMPSVEVGEWNLGGTVGVARLRRTLRSPFVFTLTENEMLVGVWAEYRFSGNAWGLRFDIERIGSDANGGGASLIYRF